MSWERNNIYYTKHKHRVILRHRKCPNGVSHQLEFNKWMQYSFIWSVARPICFQFQVVEDLRGEITLNEMSINKINASNGARYMTPHVSEQIWPRRTEPKLRMTLVISFGYCHGDKRHACPWSSHLAALNRNGENNISLSAQWGVSFVFLRLNARRAVQRQTDRLYCVFSCFEDERIEEYEFHSVDLFEDDFERLHRLEIQSHRLTSHLDSFIRCWQKLTEKHCSVQSSDDPPGWLCIGFQFRNVVGHHTRCFGTQCWVWVNTPAT